jgi:hypothetical protein
VALGRTAADMDKTVAATIQEISLQEISQYWTRDQFYSAVDVFVMLFHLVQICDQL